MTPAPTLVTRPSLPPLEDFIASLGKIWESGRLTNNGPFHRQFETALAEYLNVPYVSVFCNGTIALQVGLQALEITGEVITTPFTFAATTHAIHWNRCTPVFCDIDPGTCNLDPRRVEQLITPHTSCILPVHVYGIPCNVDHLATIASEHGLKLFYDAAHTFGASLDGVPLCHYGDLSMLSFHATKVFQTIEGGALVMSDPQLKQRVDFLRNFGFANETTILAPGTNGKMNELQAAFGLLQLAHIDDCLAARRALVRSYRRHLVGIPGIALLPEPPGALGNGSYMPVFVDSEVYGMTRDALYAALQEEGIFGRRYFYPLISNLPDYSCCPGAGTSQLPVANAAADGVICLPLFAELPQETLVRICSVIQSRCGQTR